MLGAAGAFRLAAALGLPVALGCVLTFAGGLGLSAAAYAALSLLHGLARVTAVTAAAGFVLVAVWALVARASVAR